MMKYRVIKYFIDLKDGNHPYNVGDSFPFDGKEVEAKRIEELSTNENRQGVPLIAKVARPSRKKKES